MAEQNKTEQQTTNALQVTKTNGEIAVPSPFQDMMMNLFTQEDLYPHVTPYSPESIVRVNLTLRDEEACIIKCRAESECLNVADYIIAAAQYSPLLHQYDSIMSCESNINEMMKMTRPICNEYSGQLIRDELNQLHNILLNFSRNLCINTLTYHPSDMPLSLTFPNMRIMNSDYFIDVGIYLPMDFVTETEQIARMFHTNFATYIIYCAAGNDKVFNTAYLEQLIPHLRNILHYAVFITDDKDSLITRIRHEVYEMWSTINAELLSLEFTPIC